MWNKNMVFVEIYKYGLYLFNNTFSITIYFKFGRDFDLESEPIVPPVPINLLVFGSFKGIVGLVVPVEPNNNESREILITSLINNPAFSDNPRLQYKLFDSENAFNTFREGYDYEDLLGAIIFNNNFTEYTIQTPLRYSIDPYTEPIGYYFQNRLEEVTDAEKYTFLFSPLQVIANQAILQLKTKKPIDIQVNVGKLSKSSEKISILSLEENMGRHILKAYIYPVIFALQIIMIVTNILNEKAKGLEQGLLAIGVNPSAIWLSWEIFYLPLNIFIALLSTIYDLTENGMFTHINGILGFLYIVTYGISTYGFAVLMTKLFKKASAANFMLFIFYFCIMFLLNYIYELDASHPFLLKLICVLISPINYHVGLRKISEDKILRHSNSSFAGSFLLLICSVLLYHGIVMAIEYYSLKYSNLLKRKGNFISDPLLYKEDIEDDPTNRGKPLIIYYFIFIIY
ncbi:hypothetical protein PIROE2DRAFT_63908 [Piromyces sp. E2]|nr:hypothetical protein PIROE2DRAFT_63908 [Piromyces sp. E2]|eukprot:OUM59226.1 hypothetical protein PIROE2DRAFT_63908 [Piromyces sp. E2]